MIDDGLHHWKQVAVKIGYKEVVGTKCGMSGRTSRLDRSTSREGCPGKPKSVAFIGSLREGRWEPVMAAAITSIQAIPGGVNLLIVHDRPGVNAIVARMGSTGGAPFVRGDPRHADNVVLLGEADDDWLEDICRQVSEKLSRVPLPPFVQWKDILNGNKDG